MFKRQVMAVKVEFKWLKYDTRLWQYSCFEMSNSHPYCFNYVHWNLIASFLYVCNPLDSRPLRNVENTLLELQKQWTEHFFLLRLCHLRCLLAIEGQRQPRVCINILVYYIIKPIQYI